LDDNAMPRPITPAKFLLFPAVLAVILFATACTPKYNVVTPELHANFMAELKAGKPNLTCLTSCHWSWLKNFDQMMILANSSQWEPLAILVMQVGYETDMAYYFLGRSAEGLGNRQAAVSYYQVSSYLTGDSNKLHHCREWQLGCGGIDLASVLAERLAAVQTGNTDQNASQISATETNNSLPIEDTSNNTVMQEDAQKENGSKLQPAVWVIDTIKGVPFVRGTQVTLFGANAKVVLSCVEKKFMFLTVYEAGDMADSLATGNYIHSLGVNYSDFPLPRPASRTYADGYVNTAFVLKPKQVNKIYAVNSWIGHRMQVTREAPSYFGFSIEVNQDAAKLIRDYIDNCRNNGEIPR
jgi:hypothetical protein